MTYPALSPGRAVGSRELLFSFNLTATGCLLGGVFSAASATSEHPGEAIKKGEPFPYTSR